MIGNFCKIEFENRSNGKNWKWNAVYDRISDKELSSLLSIVNVVQKIIPHKDDKSEFRVVRVLVCERFRFDPEWENSRWPEGAEQ